MSSPHERNDRKRPSKGAAPWVSRDRARPKSPRVEEGGLEWSWGWHAVVAALENPNRGAPKRLLATRDRAAELTARLGKLERLEILETGMIGRELPAGAAHQGVALKGPPLDSAAIDDLGSPAEGVLVMLDQLTDPQNVGAIFRTALALGARGIVLQDRHAPPLAGALAKAAAGAVDILPHARVTNLSRALEQLADLGWRAIGLDGAATSPLDEVLDARPTVLVLGSEGDGLRRLVSEHCDALGRIPMPGGFESLNVSAAAAIALYETCRIARRGN